MILMIKRARLSFPELWVPVAAKNSDHRRYGASLLLPKNDPQIPSIKAAIAQAGKEKWGEKFDDPKFRKSIKYHAFRDGDDKDYDGYADHFVVASYRSEKKRPPLVLDYDRRELRETDGRPYGGCYVNAKVDFYGFDEHGASINAELLGIQFAAHGDSFGSSSRATVDDFEDVELEVEDGLDAPVATVDEDDEFDPLA